ncbi:hypothetical protein [Prauserella muralis]|uniref:Uncharacterized protein n=1 Tax=Prauserella muralis TaxID=588067 RepID=A0A2V4AZ58_9PSEU|nr:hypothetical protein [Prauserella muralis]PXY21220.1 hypothetical protein BAY60_27590 [Prauserella muralis]TWE30330.1 hypothetical protein FHX69_3027 [Prauserella muralis]
MAQGITRGSRSAGVLPLLAGITSALALTGAAVYTVGQVSCAEPGQYVRHDDHVELVGSCVDGSRLPQTGTGGPKTGVSGAVLPDNYRP